MRNIVIIIASLYVIINLIYHTNSLVARIRIKSGIKNKRKTYIDGVPFSFDDPIEVIKACLAVNNGIYSKEDLFDESKQTTESERMIHILAKIIKKAPIEEDELNFIKSEKTKVMEKLNNLVRFDIFKLVIHFIFAAVIIFVIFH